MAGKKFTLTFSEKTLELLEILRAKKGVSKSVLVALAIEEFYRKEKIDDIKK